MIRVLLLGGTGTAGRATAQALLEDGHDVTCLVRPGRSGPPATRTICAELGDPKSLADALRDVEAQVVVSCMASRTGAPRDAWSVDHDLHVRVLDWARRAEVDHVVLLSAICVQKPRLQFQHAKLAFEDKLIASGLAYSIVRPTSLFKSLSGQVRRVKAGRPYLIFGDGTLTATKPISDRDLARYVADCLTDRTRRNRILPIGGPDPALTPVDLGHMLFRLADRPPRFRRVPPSLFTVASRLLTLGGSLRPSLREKAEFARIAHYYATESMLVWDPAEKRYDAEATPSFGSDPIEEHFARLLSGAAEADLAEHRLFERSLP